jgi:hypothetical protein
MRGFRLGVNGFVYPELTLNSDKMSSEMPNKAIQATPHKDTARLMARCWAARS